MPKTLDYARPKPPKPMFSPLAWALIASGFEHFLILGLYGTALDGGQLAGKCIAVSAGYWAVVLLILVRRHQRLSAMDLAFIAIGYPILFIVCLFAASLRT